MSQDRRKQNQPVTEPVEQRKLELALHASARSQKAGFGHLSALMQLLADSGIDCSDFVEAADHDGPRVLH